LDIVLLRLAEVAIAGLLLLMVTV